VCVACVVVSGVCTWRSRLLICSVCGTEYVMYAVCVAVSGVSYVDFDSYVVCFPLKSSYMQCVLRECCVYVDFETTHM